MSFSKPTFFDDVVIFLLVLWVLSYCTMEAGAKGQTRLNFLKEKYELVLNDKPPRQMKHGQSCTRRDAPCTEKNKCKLQDDDVCLKDTLKVIDIDKNPNDKKDFFVRPWDWIGVMECNNASKTCECLKGPHDKEAPKPIELFYKNTEKFCVMQNLPNNHQCIDPIECKSADCGPIDVLNADEDDSFDDMFKYDPVNYCSYAVMHPKPKNQIVLMITSFIVYFLAHL